MLCNRAAHESASGAWPVFCPHTEHLSPNPAESAQRNAAMPKHPLRPQAGERQRFSPHRGDCHPRSRTRAQSWSRDRPLPFRAAVPTPVLAGAPAPSLIPAALFRPCGRAHHGPRGWRAVTGTARPRRARAGRAATTAPPSWCGRRAPRRRQGAGRGRGRAGGGAGPVRERRRQGGPTRERTPAKPETRSETPETPSEPQCCRLTTSLIVHKRVGMYKI